MTDENTAQVEPNQSQPQPKEKHVGRSTLIWICLFVLFVVLVATLMFIQHQYELQQSALASMQDQLLQEKEKLNLDHEVLAKEVEQQLVGQQTQVQQALEDMSSRVDSNATKLLALSSVNRDDWKLVEVDYLLRMAGYRVLIEKDNVNALALANSADEVMRSMDQTGMQSIRKILAEEIAVIKLAGRVDREGIYMQLSALANQIDALPFVQPLGADPEPDEGVSEDEDKTFRQKLNDFFARVLHKLGSYIRVRDHGKSVNAILPPAEQNYLRQNLRLMIEQSQAAILRGEEQIYRDSLVKAQNWINQYYDLNEKSRIMLDELHRLEQENVAPEYNNFENSRIALQEYIQRQQQAAIRRGGR